MARVEEVHPGKDSLVPERLLWRLHRLEIDVADPQVTREADVPVDGGEKPQTNSVNIKSVAVCRPKERVVLPEGGQGGKDVTAHRTRSRVIKKPVRLRLDLGTRRIDYVDVTLFC